MKFWKMRFIDEKYDELKLEEKLSYEFLEQFDGRPLKNTWHIPSVCRMEPEKGLPLGDAVNFLIPAFKERTLTALYPLIQDSVEVLDLDFPEEKFFGINVTTLLDVIDYKKSKYKLFSDGKRVMYFKQYAFKETPELYKYNIFKLIDEAKGRAFVNDKFKNAVEENHLTGFVFELVWDSEADK